MLKRDQLETLRSMTGFNIWQAEKDYLQHMFLMFLSRRVGNELVFKGGTCLQKSYGLDRFSIDLDFTAGGAFDAGKTVEKICTDFRVAGIPTEPAIEKKKAGTAVSIRMNGPLYDGKDRTQSVLRVDISEREEVILKPLAVEVVAFYPDIQPYIVHAMQEREILAEKVRAVMSRGKARDVYDIWFLLRKGVRFDIDLATAKLRYYGLEWDAGKFREGVAGRKGVWKTEMEQLVQRVPDFREVSGFITESVPK